MENKYFGMSAPECMKAMLEAMTGQKVTIVKGRVAQENKDSEEIEEEYDEEDIRVIEYED